MFKIGFPDSRDDDDKQDDEIIFDVDGIADFDLTVEVLPLYDEELYMLRFGS